jgi:hypothetical protein
VPIEKRHHCQTPRRGAQKLMRISTIRVYDLGLVCVCSGLAELGCTTTRAAICGITRAVAARAKPLTNAPIVNIVDGTAALAG